MSSFLIYWNKLWPTRLLHPDNKMRFRSFTAGTVDYDFVTIFSFWTGTDSAGVGFTPFSFVTYCWEEVSCWPVEAVSFTLRVSLGFIIFKLI
jgi:hypothetical protein